MLGAGTWFTALAIPTAGIAGFIASRKRLSLQWREELMDPDGGIYPVVTESELEVVRKVSPAAKAHEAPEGYPITPSENIGLAVQMGVFSGLEAHVMLDEVKRWVALYGNKLDGRKVQRFGELARFRSKAEDAPELELPGTVDTSFLGDVRIISDHPEDIQLMKTPWGVGDRIKLAEMPASLRHVVDRVRSTYWGLGRLRHVYVEYSPQGQMYHEPRATKAFDGHDYVVIPLQRDGGGTVTTFSPMLRSKFAVLGEVMRNSWTNRDYDVLLPLGSTMRVYGQARYNWCWAFRPGDTWFGNSQNVLRRYHSPEPPIQPSVWRRWWGCAAALLHVRKAEETATDVQRESAVIVLHFEGPRAQAKKRSLLFHPEILIFGTPPTVETYERWVDDRPTEETVYKDGVVLFMVKNYFNMLQSS